MKKTFIIFAIVVCLAAVFGTVIYRAYIKTPYTMAWDMAAHTYYGAELCQDIRHGHPIAFLDHINTSSIALWPFLHPLMLSLWFLIFGFSDKTAVLLTIVFSSLCIIGGFVATWLSSNKKSLIPGLVAVFFFISSPLFIAFSNYVMLEIFGLFFMLAAVISLSLSIEYEKRWSRILLAVSLLLTFLIKINYGIYIFMPFLIFEMLNLPENKRKDYRRLLMQFLDLKNLNNVLNILIAVNIVLLIVMKLFGGFSFHLSGWKVELSGIKNPVYLLLSLIFFKVIIFYIKERRLIFQTLLSRHLSIFRIVIIPLFLWFLINPGRISEFIRMSADRKTDFAIIGFRNIFYYPIIFVADYNSHPAIGITVLLITLFSAVRWKQNPQLIRFLHIMIFFGYIGLTLKLPDFAGSRFIFIQAMALFIVASFGIWRISCDLSSLNRYLQPVYYLILIVGVLLLSWFPVRFIYNERISGLILKSAPTMKPKLQTLIDKLIRQIEPAEKKICILGGSNEISPFLLKWTMIKIHPDMMPVYVEPPVKQVKTDEEKALFENWLIKGESDAIIAVEIMSVSPFAQTDDFKSFHADKQAVVAYMKKQDIYYLAGESSWGNMAAGIKLYKQSKAK